MKTLKVIGTDMLSYDSPFINVNGNPLAVKTRAQFKEDVCPIYLLFTKDAQKMGKLGFCFFIPQIFFSWWLNNDPTRRIVCQAKKWESWYWLKLANADSKLFTYQGVSCLRFGLQNFDHQKERPFYTPRKFKCLKKKA